MISLKDLQYNTSLSKIMTWFIQNDLIKLYSFYRVLSNGEKISLLKNELKRFH